jgi:hypothetical protein
MKLSIASVEMTGFLRVVRTMATATATATTTTNAKQLQRQLQMWPGSSLGREAGFSAALLTKA